MRHRRWVIGHVGLVAALAALAFPGAGSSFAGFEVVLTASGASPANARFAGAEYPIWFNQDTVAHTITFADGCSFQVAPNSGGVDKCRRSWTGNGAHGYTIDAKFRARLTRVPSYRRVTLNSKNHGFYLGSRVRLHGILVAGMAGVGPGADFSSGMPVTVFARPRGHRFWYPIAVVMAKPLKNPNWNNPHSVWQLWASPHGDTTYRVQATSHPGGWQRAQSKPFGVFVRRR